MIASHHAPPRRFAGRTSLGFAGALALLGSSTSALAQAEAEKPAPNVLLLVDSSGSMEFTTSGSAPVCTPGSAASQKSRWIELVEALTGKIADYSCWGQDRSLPAFNTEFQLGGFEPYDYRYVNKYHRALSNNCLYAPGVVDPAAPYAWPAVPVTTHPFSAGAVQAGACTFNQATDGVLDVYKEMVRFGLMTFDARIGIGTGLTTLNTADYSSGFDGNWSYSYPNDEPVTGHPANCDPEDPVFQEVGARNAAAPPWEGRMIAFGPPNRTPTDPLSLERNDWIQKVLLSTRPYGATPIAGQLDDARKFLWSDISNDPLNAGEEFGPVNDPNWRADSCRKTILILLTDGEPNLDLRPFCEMSGTPDGKCPYDQPEDIVEALYEVTGDDDNVAPPGHMSVETYVVGFAIGEVTLAGDTTPTSCSALDTLTDCTAAKIAANPSLTTCCTLNKIANAGGKEEDGITPRNARFASSQAELTAIFTDILDDVIQIATRTTPVFSSPGGDAVSKGFKFFSAFDPRPDPTQPQLWEGVLERSRYLCTADVPGITPLNANEGDDFAANLNSGLGPARHFYSVLGSTSADTAGSIRPYYTEADDDIVSVTGDEVDAQTPAGLTTAIEAAAMGVTPAERTTILEHLLGINTTGPSRCGDGDCSRLGGIYHSVPVVVPGRPSELLRDESYERFIKRMFDIKRPSVLYTSTVDGFLHAFNVAPFPGSEGAEGRRIKTKENNELWAFIPPAVVPVLDNQYPANPVVLLDGLPIIKDVVATVTGTDDDREVTSYERGQTEAKSGSGEWRTVLVQGFGATSEVKGGYFALDITEPDRGVTAGDARPIFRWQLTESSSGAPLFGLGGTPLITTVFISESPSAPPREVAVAVLPGGDVDVTPGPGPVAIDANLVMDTIPSGFKTTRPVRAYPAGTENARSLTIVRLDTGEVIQTFRPNLGPFTNPDLVEVTAIPAPITGQPKAYPEITGAVADRIYVGDRDGRLWRVDVSSQDPTKWSMTVFYDAFEDGTTAAVGQPVFLPPVLSVDEIGDVTVAFATGSQELDSSLNRVVSLTETLVADETKKNFVTHVNWIHKLGDPDDPLDPARGDRVTGPMVLFNSALYYAVSHAPQTTGNACDVGSSKVYGVHYIQSKDFQTALESGEAPDPETGPAAAPGGSDIEIVRQAGLVFGVSLEAEPSCFDGVAEVGGNDSFGYGTVMMAKKVNPGKYYLTYGASGNSGDARGVLEVKQQLPSPNLAVTFDSWAVVYE